MSLLKTSALNGIAVVVRTGHLARAEQGAGYLCRPGRIRIDRSVSKRPDDGDHLCDWSNGNGVVKLTAEYPRCRSPTQDVAHSGLLVFVTSHIGAGMILGSGKRWRRPSCTTSDIPAFSPGWRPAFPLSRATQLLLAIMNGKKEVRRFVVSNIGGSIVSLLVTGILAWQFGLTVPWSR